MLTSTIILPSKSLELATVRLHVSNYSQLSNYNFADKLEQNTAVNKPITFEEIVIFMINGIVFTPITFEEIVIVMIYPFIMTITISSNVIGV